MSVAVRHWWVVMVATVAGCIGDPPPLPEIPGTTSTTTEGASSSGTGTTADASTGPAAECGNGQAEEGEECDGTDMRDTTCESLGFVPGTLACKEDCSLDVSGCTYTGMVLVPGGEFEMGSTESPERQPVRQVFVDTFYIDEREVSVVEFAECVGAVACPAPDPMSMMNSVCNWDAVKSADPMNCVTWEDARAYCEWVDGGGWRLPTEAEWEKAARGTDARTYPWGDEPAPSCSYVVMADGELGCGMGGTWPTYSKPLGESPFGALNMAGNVWEWVNDWYGEYDPADLDNPTGPRTGTERVIRGGSWADVNPDAFRTFHRIADDPAFVGDRVGFRCVTNSPMPR